MLDETSSFMVAKAPLQDYAQAVVQQVNWTAK